LHSYNNCFSSNKGVFQRSQTLTYILTKKKLHNKFFEVLHITWLMYSTWTLICNMIFVMSHQLWIMHINFCKDFCNGLSCGQRISSWIIMWVKIFFMNYHVSKFFPHELSYEQKKFSWIIMCESCTLIEIMINWWWFTKPLLNYKIQSPNKLPKLSFR